jgi:hypothetical protein
MCRVRARDHVCEACTRKHVQAACAGCLRKVHVHKTCTGCLRVIHALGACAGLHAQQPRTGCLSIIHAQGACAGNIGSVNAQLACAASLRRIYVQDITTSSPSHLLPLRCLSIAPQPFRVVQDVLLSTPTSISSLQTLTPHNFLTHTLPSLPPYCCGPLPPSYLPFPPSAGCAASYPHQHQQHIRDGRPGAQLCGGAGLGG